MLMGVISVLGEVELFRADRLSRCRPAVGARRVRHVVRGVGCEAAAGPVATMLTSPFQPRR